MKRYRSAAFVVVLVAFLARPDAKAQGVTQSPQEAGPQDQVLQEQQRRELERFVNLLARAQRGGGGRGTPGGVNLPTPLRGPVTKKTDGAWWTNTALVQQLGLTDEQKAKIERAFENHRQTIVSSTAQLEKEEAQLARLLEAEPLDRNAVFTQIDRVVQARGEMERANAAMTLEMREYLTRAQWMQLQGQSGPPRVSTNLSNANLISHVPPVYPEVARQAGIQGVVIVDVEINREGAVDNVRALAGPQLLIQPALDAVKQWRYKPFRMNNELVPVLTTIPVTFPFSGVAGGERGTPALPRGGGGRGQRAGGPGQQ